MFLFWHSLIYSFLISIHVITSACFEVSAISKITARKKTKKCFLDWSINCTFSFAVCVCWGIEVFPASWCGPRSVLFPALSSSLQLVVLSHCQPRDCLSVGNTSAILLFWQPLRAQCCQQSGTGGTPPTMPQRKCYCHEAFARFLFWLWLVVGTQAHWHLVNPGKASASLTPALTPFPAFQSRCFPIWEMHIFLSSHTGRCGMPVVACIPRDPAVPAVMCQIQTWTQVLPRGLGMRTMCALCKLSRCLAPQGQVNDALPQHKPFTEFPWALVNGGVPSSFPALKRRKKSGSCF